MLDELGSWLGQWVLGGHDVVRGRTVYMRPPVSRDYKPWAALRASSREFLTKWEPHWRHDHLTVPAFRRRLRWAGRAVREDRCYTYFIFRIADDALLGGIVVENIRRWPAASGSLGYWIGEQYAGCGYMADAVGTIVPHAFTELSLSRVEAACVPENDASRALLLRCGFQREGQAQSLLEINGKWRDHELYARLRSDRADSQPAAERQSGLTALGGEHSGG